MIRDITEINFPSYATLSSATVTHNDMGEKTITAQAKIDGSIKPDFSFDWLLMFKGERYIHPLRKPQAAKDNTSMRSVIDLTFQHWAVYQLKRYYFVEMTSIESGTAIADKYIASLSLNLGDFITAFNRVLEYYYGDSITAELYSEWAYDKEPVTIGISYTYIWDLLATMYDNYGVRWQIVPDTTNNSKYIIKFGYPTIELNHIFEYGYEGGLLKVERQVQSEDIKNILLGRGGEQNLPYRYFKDTDPDNKSWPADPDWVPELKNIYFSELRGSAFRSYIQGWKAKHYYGTVTPATTKVQWAFIKGYTDTKFAPVEYVKDDTSIAKYGELWGGLDNNEDIYPSIQGVTVSPHGRIDRVVAVEEILSDDIITAAEGDAQLQTAPVAKGHFNAPNLKEKAIEVTVFTRQAFTVPEGKMADLVIGSKDVKAYYMCGTFPKAQLKTMELDETDFEVEVVATNVYNKATGDSHSASGIPEGIWWYSNTIRIRNLRKEHPISSFIKEPSYTIDIAFNDAQLLLSDTTEHKWLNTFDIWVKNIWNTQKESSESNDDYAKRVWEPILGDRVGDEAKVVFSTGWLSISEDYEFVIVDYPVYDTSKIITNDDGTTRPSHWRITLAKSNAEYDATGLYLPNTKINASAGDYFYFIGIDMPHQYVLWAEERLTAYKEDQLAKVSDIKPTWVVSLDKIRITEKQTDEATTLLSQLEAGASIRLADSRFIQDVDVAEEKLYLQSVTYTYNEPSNGSPALIPDVEVVLSDSYTTTANPVTMIQGEVEALSKQVGSLSNVEQIVRAVGDKIYLRKDGVQDRSYSPTEFGSLLSSTLFRQGMVGGTGWGFFKDENGKWVFETDRLNVREDFQVNNLVINQIVARGGMIIESAANDEIVQVLETDEGYVCYFDKERGGLNNLFEVDDVAYSHVFDSNNVTLKYYKRRVLAVGENFVTLSKTEVDGTGVPQEGDVIVHYGNYTDKTRQYVKVRDVIGGGYERYIEGLDSVDATGTEYYFVGKQDGINPRWFVGYRKEEYNEETGETTETGEYIEWKDGKLNIRGTISASSTIGDKSLEEYINDAVEIKQENIEEYVNNIVNPQLEDIQKQLDGAIETWFYPGVPTLDNVPANKWTTDEEKNVHLGDLYYDQFTGKAYRFQLSGNTYVWQSITDTDIQAALEAANAAQDTADGKRKVFVVQPKTTDDYSVGDLWVNATYGTQYNNDILRCITSKAAGVAFDIAHWTLASKYTDDSSLEIFKAEYAQTMQSYKEQLDGKVETYFYNYVPTTTNAPANGWTTDAQKSEHAGDLFYNTATGYVYRWTGTAWSQLKDKDIADALAAAADAQDTADGKRRVFMAQPTTPYDEGDLWISGGADGNTLMVCTTSRATGAFVAADWVVADDAALKDFSKQIENSLLSIKDQLDQKAETWYQATDPSLNWTTDLDKSEHKGDLWYCTEDIDDTDFKKGTTWYWNGTSWQQQDVPQEVFDKIDGKAAIYISKPLNYHINDLWFLEKDYTLSGVAYKAGTLVVATMTSITWSANHWKKKDRYTDDTAANEAKAAINNLSVTVNGLNTTVSDMKSFTDTAFADGIVDRSEASAIANYIKTIDTTQKEVQNAYNTLNNNSLLTGETKTNLTNAFNAFNSSATSLINTINSAIADGLATSQERAAVESAYTDFNTKYGSFVYYLNQANKFIQDKIYAVANDALNKVEALDYIKEALKDATTINGGLVLSSLISLGVNNADFTTQTTYSGISGVHDDTKRGGGIAAWYGGDMLDKFDYYDAETGTFNVPEGKRPATGLDRMDGTGYRANGALWWDNTGKVHANPLSFFVGEDTVGALLASFQVVLQVDNKTPDYITPKVPFSSLVVGNYLQIGDGRLKWDAANHAFYVEDKNGNAAHFYTTGGVSALGMGGNSGSTGGGGASTLYELADVQANGTGDGVSGATIGSLLSYDGTHWRAIDQSAVKPDLSAYDIPSLDWSKITTGKPSTIAGYGITDAYTKTEADGKYVTLNTPQTITGQKTFSGNLLFSNSGTSLRGIQGTMGNNDQWRIMGGATAVNGYLEIATSDDANEPIYVRQYNNGTFGTLVRSITLMDASGNQVFNTVTATALKKSGGTASQFLMANGSVTTKKVLTAVSHTGWVNNATDDLIVPTMSFMAYWNGAYASSGASNLAYCNKGAFGTVVTHAHSEYVTALGTSGNYLTWTRNGAVNNITVPYATTATKVGTATVGGTANPIYLNAGTPTAISASVGSASQPVYLSSGTITACQAGSLFSSLTSSAATNLSITVAGQNRVLSNVYARYLSNLYTVRQANMNVSFGDGTLRHFKATSTTTTGKPNSGDAHILHLSWDNTGGYDGQIALPTAYANPMQWRVQTAGTYNNWKTLLDSSSYTSYTVTKTGGGASGTWGINITGNASTATNADMVDGVHLNGLFTNFSLSNSQLTATVGGVSKTVETVLSKRTGGYTSMNAVAALGNCMGITNLSGTSKLVNPNAQTSWHHFINLSYNYEAANMWQTQFAIKAGTTQVWVRSRAGGSISDSTEWSAPWVQLARTTDNVASATTLQTPRTLWGQPFNGSANVSGNMTGVGSISMNGTITCGTYAMAQTFTDNWSDGTNSHPWYGIDHRYGNTGVYSTTISDYYGMTLKTANGRLSFTSGGNVGIGTNSPTHRLHVSGTLCATGAATLSSTLSVSGTTTAAAITAYNVYPRSNNTYSCGTSTYRWSYVYAQQLDVAGNIYHPYGGIFKSFLIDASSLNVNTYYPVTIPLSMGYETQIQIRVALNTSVPSWSTHPAGFSVAKWWSCFGSGWGTNAVNRKVYTSSYIWAESDPVRGIGQMTNSSIEYVYVRGGGKYYFYVTNDAVPTLRTSTFTQNNESVSPTTTAPEIIRSWSVSDNFNSTASPLIELTEGGYFHATQGIYSDGFITALAQGTSSDARMKTYVRDVNLSLEDIAKAPSIEFTWNKNGKNAAGTYAQYWEKLLPQAVNKGVDGYLSLQYGVVSLLSTIAVAKCVVTMEKRIKEMEDELRTLKTR